jgi:TATA-binding protein-associated factor Taf7
MCSLRTNRIEMNHQNRTGQKRYWLFDLYFKTMLRRKFCEHPTRHINSPAEPRVLRSVSIRLADFIRNRYDLDGTNVSGLCAKCYASESKEREEDETMDVEENISSSRNSSDKDEQEQEQEEEEENEETEENDDDDHDENSCDDSLHELTYQQQEAMEELSNTFRVLNMSRIHDR